ncbi:MAG: DUF6684 family protein [Haloarculaceae archaeon]
MGLFGFDRDTLLDLTVNVVPLVILVFFLLLFAIVQAWQWNAFMFVVSQGLLIVPFVLLSLLTYVAARAISTGDADRTASPHEE